MSTNSSGAKGMLSKEAARKSVFANMVDLYKSDLAFRGMTDFAIIGALAMMFLDPPHKVQWPWSGGGGQQTYSGSGQRSGPGALVGTDPLSPGTGARAPSGAGSAVAIPFPDLLKNPRIGADFVFDIDPKPFSSTSAADQPRLAAARAAAALAKPDDVIEALRQADGNDPNVALLRGVAFAMRGTNDANRTAEALWRQAINGGSTQARALLGRLLMRMNTAARATEAQQLIEAGAAAGDRQAMRLAGIGYLSGEFGVLNPPKGAELLKQAADAGDAMAMAVYAHILSKGIGLAAADAVQAERYLRQSANAGFTLAQSALGDWLKDQYGAGLLPDPKEAISWLRQAYEKGHSLSALNSLVYIHAVVAKVPPWKDIPRAMAYLRRCSGLEYGLCQYDTATAWKLGYFGSVNKALARAHLQIALSLDDPRAPEEARKLDKELSQAEIAEATALEPKIRAALQPTFPLIPLQYSEIAIPPPPVAVASDLRDVTNLPDLNFEPQKGPRQTGGESADVAALRARAQAHMKDKDYDSAIADFTDVIRRGNATWEDYNQRGMAHHSKNELDLALEDYNRAIERNPQAAPTYFNRALIHGSRGRIDNALAEIDIAIRENSRSPVYFITRGNFHFNKGNYRSSIEDYTKYIDLLEKDASASTDDKALGYLYRGKAEVQAALQSCNAMIPPDRSCRDPAGYATAILDLEQALLAKPDYAEAHFQLGWIADTLGNKRKAIESYTYALKNDSNNSTAYNNRGVIYGDMGQRDLALADYNDAIRVDPSNKFAWANRGALFSGIRRQRKQAIADYRRALEIDPNYDYAIQGLRKLGVRR